MVVDLFRSFLSLSLLDSSGTLPSPAKSGPSGENDRRLVLNIDPNNLAPMISQTKFTSKSIFVIQIIVRDHALIKIKVKRSKILNASAEFQHRNIAMVTSSL